MRPDTDIGQPDDTEIAIRGHYQAADGEQRLVWAVEEGRVRYFTRRDGGPWTNAPPTEWPTVQTFLADTSPIAVASAIGPVKGGEVVGDGDW